MDIFLRVLIFVLGLAVVISTLFSALSNFVLPRRARSRLNRILFGLLRRVFEKLMRFVKPSSRRTPSLPNPDKPESFLPQRTQYPFPLRGRGGMVRRAGMVCKHFTVKVLSSPRPELARDAHQHQPGRVRGRAGSTGGSGTATESGSRASLAGFRRVAREL